MKKIDLYIIRKFLGTFFFSIILILMIVVVFDFSERVEDFITRKPTVSAIVFEYYCNFLPFFANLFSPLFTFIAVIYFTSRMAYRSEIIAILGSGVSFKRFLLPYMISAAMIAGLSLFLSHYVIPQSNGVRLAFEEKYIRSQYWNNAKNIHRQLDPETFIYISSYNTMNQNGDAFSYEKIKDGTRYYYLKAGNAAWDSTGEKWMLTNYFIRTLDGMKEKVTTGAKLDTALNFFPTEFGTRENIVEAMQTPELNEFIASEKQKGSYKIPYYEVEKHRRSSFPFATFVLTLIGAIVASRKVRGGIGWHIGMGLGLSFTYILFMQVSTTFATNGGMPALIAVWIPNIIFSVIALVMLRGALK